MIETQQYHLDADDAAALKDMVVAPIELRRSAIATYLDEHGLAATLNLFAQSLGMANSVANNCRGMAELFLLEHSDMHPHTAEKINLPTMLGACMGAALSAKCDPLPKGACEGCAYRLGTMANQSEIATDDAAYVLFDRKGFMCHADLNDHGKPTKVCAGHAKASAGNYKTEELG